MNIFPNPEKLHRGVGGTFAAVEHAIFGEGGRVVFAGHLSGKCDRTCPMYEPKADSMTQERDPALVERLIELAKNVRDSGAYRSARFAEEARSILAELFPPADPDVLEAREIYIRANALGGEDAVFTRSGEMDDTQDVRMALAAIKRGRELARQEGGR